MASNGTRRRACDQVVGTARRLGKGDGAALRELLTVERVERAVAAEGVKFRRCLFTPLLTLWTFLGQVLDPDRSCRNAVQKLLAFLAVGGVPWGGGRGPDEQDPCGPDTGPYCKARARLPEALVSRLAKESGEDLHRRLPSGRLLGGRPVKVVDGTTCSMPDTAENQKAWPQPPTQKPGLGFPLVRLVAVLSLNCAAVLGLAIGPYAGKQSGETALLRGLLESDPDALRAGDVLLADRYYASYWMLALLRGRGVDGVFRQHQLRATDFRRGRRLGREDHVVVWRKPEQRPEWMDQAAYEQVPAELTVREVRVWVTQRGFRVRSLVLATTLLDAAVYGKQDLAEAFRCRWHVELDLRSIKRTMGMSVLRCKTPAMVRKEIWMQLLAYNLIRTLMARAAREAGLEPRQVSFAGAVQALNAFAPVLRLADQRDLPRLWEILLRAIARWRVGNRPDRYEPRAVKRRAKPIALLTVPRRQARERLGRSGASKC